MTKCDLGFCALAGTQLSDSAATGKDRRPTVGKRRQLKLLGDQLVAVDENQTARVERHRPSPRRANYTVITDIHCLPRHIAEILDHSAADLAVRPRIDTHSRIHRHRLSPVSPAVPLAPFIRLFICRHPFGATLGGAPAMDLVAPGLGAVVVRDQPEIFDGVSIKASARHPAWVAGRLLWLLRGQRMPPRRPPWPPSRNGMSP